MQKRITVFLALAALCVGFTASAQSTDPWVGTWKVNLTKSTYSPGPKPTSATIVKIEPSGDGYKTTFDGVNLEGKPTHTETVWKFDGKDNPITGAPTSNTTAAYKRIDSRTFEVTGKVEGKPTMMTRVAVSADGTTLTATQTGKNAQGESVRNVIVNDKQ